MGKVGKEMPKRVPITEQQYEWLEDNHTKVSYEHMAEQLNCCVDTLKRILVRRGLQEFDGAKYQLPRDHDKQMWTRPCVCCGDTKPRDRGYYMCIRCRAKAGYIE